MSGNRKLNAIEQSMEIMNCLGHSWYGSVWARIKGVLSEDVLREALDILQCRHVRLNSCIVGFPDDMRFETLEALKLPLDCIVRQHSDQWKDVISYLIGEMIESDKWLMRATLVHYKDDDTISDLIITVHHAISDAGSTIQLLSEILTYCQKIASGHPLPEIIRLSPLPPVEDMFPESMKARMKPSSGIPRFDTLPIDNSVPSELRRAGVVYRDMDRSETLRLLASCDSERTTFHCALWAAAAFVLADLIGKENVHIGIDSNVSVRAYLKDPVSNDHLSPLISEILTAYTVKPDTSFWELAREVSHKILVGFCRGDIITPMLNMRESVESILSNSDIPNTTADITTIGNLDIPADYSPFYLEKICTPIAEGIRATLTFVAHIFRERVHFEIAYCEPLYLTETVENIASRVLDVLTNASRSNI